MKNETNTTAVRNSNTPGTIAFILALVSVAIWAFVGVEFFIIRDQMMNSVVLLASVIGWIPLTASFVLAIIGLCRKDASKGLARTALILDIVQLPVVALPTLVMLLTGLVMVTV